MAFQPHALVATVTYTKVFRAARGATFTPEIVRGPLAARPYDLRHAAVSTWLAAGIPAATAGRGQPGTT